MVFFLPFPPPSPEPLPAAEPGLSGAGRPLPGCSRPRQQQRALGRAKCPSPAPGGASRIKKSNFFPIIYFRGGTAERRRGGTGGCGHVPFNPTPKNPLSTGAGRAAVGAPGAGPPPPFPQCAPHPSSPFSSRSPQRWKLLPGGAAERRCPARRGRPRGGRWGGARRSRAPPLEAAPGSPAPLPSVLMLTYSHGTEY